jgi:hypothetical protein
MVVRVLRLMNARKVLTVAVLAVVILLRTLECLCRVLQPMVVVTLTVVVVHLTVDQ